MSLRARLLIVIGILIATFAVTSILVVVNQRSLLIDQVDQRLMSIPPFRITTTPAGAQESPSTGPADSFSDTFIGLINQDGTIEPKVVGSLLETPPAFDPTLIGMIHPGETRTLPDTATGKEFRAYIQFAPGHQFLMITALPLREIDDAVSRLERTLLLSGLLILGVLAALYFWIQRLGLAPITRLAKTADAVTAGDRSQRAVDVDPRTEAGKLGIAFNVMLDERDEAEARLRQFIADASHELRTPLTSVRGYLDLYRQGAFRDQAQMDDAVRRLSSETNRMIGLVKDLLSLASLDEGRPLRYELTDLSRVLQDAIQDAQVVQPARPLAADVPASGLVVCADESQIVQLVGILLTNAMQHTPVESAVVLHAQILHNQAIITVADTGPGFDKEAAEHAFDRFWRGESSRKRSAAGGSGLGLSIAKSIVDAHGGTITLDSAPELGTTFTIRLPVALDRCSTDA